MTFEFQPLSIPDVVLIKPNVFKDARGFFAETYKFSDFAKVGIRERFVQDNHTRSVKGVLRGLHYQTNPSAQGKLLRCIEGSIFDVAVDIRKGSPTYGKWVSAELSSDNRMMVYIPPGFAHGFIVISSVAEVIYKCTSEHSPVSDKGIIWNDPTIAVKWPTSNPILSDKDSKHKTLGDADNNFEYIK